MTYNEILRIEEFIKEIKTLKESNDKDEVLKTKTQTLNDKIGSSFIEYKTMINWNSMSTSNDKLSTEGIKHILDIMVSTLNELLERVEEYPEIIDLRKDIDEGQKLYKPHDNLSVYNDSANEYIAKMMVKYSSVLDDYQKKHFMHKSTFADVKLFTEVLEKHMRTILTKNQSSLENNNPIIQVQNTQNTTAQANVTVDVKIDIENLIDTVQESGLNEETIKEAIEQINKIKSISEEKSKRSEKWTKLKEILKWTIEQGIQVATLIIPLILQMIK